MSSWLHIHPLLEVPHILSFRLPDHCKNLAGFCGLVVGPFETMIYPFIPGCPYAFLVAFKQILLFTLGMMIQIDKHTWLVVTGTMEFYGLMVINGE